MESLFGLFTAEMEILEQRWNFIAEDTVASSRQKKQRRKPWTNRQKSKLTVDTKKKLSAELWKVLYSCHIGLLLSILLYDFHSQTNGIFRFNTKPIKPWAVPDASPDLIASNILSASYRLITHSVRNTLLRSRPDLHTALSASAFQAPAQWSANYAVVEGPRTSPAVVDTTARLSAAAVVEELGASPAVVDAARLSTATVVDALGTSSAVVDAAARLSTAAVVEDSRTSRAVVKVAARLSGLAVVAGIADTTVAAAKMDKNKLVICMVKMVLLVIKKGFGGLLRK